MALIGEELKRERELRGISLQEISEATKINIRHLRDLEEDRLENLPGKFFIKGIIRTYAKYIGLDEIAVLNSFYETELFKKEEEESKKEDKEEYIMLPARFKKIVFFVTIFLVFMAMLITIYLLVYKKPEVQEPVQVTPPPAAMEEEITAIQAPVPQEEERELVLDLTFRLETWIQVYADGQIVINGTKMPGESAQVTAKKELLIHTGNAGGVIFQLNNKKGISLGRDGAVVKDVRITLENMAAFIEKEEGEIFL
jgi:transcriptional regulator with XRE-family HTH domain